MNVDALAEGEDLDMEVSRAQFNKLCKPYFDKTLKITEETLKRAKLKITDIDEIVMVGGSSRIPAVKEAIENYFNK